MRLATAVFAAGLTLLGIGFVQPAPAKAGVYVNVPGFSLYVNPRHHRYYRHYGYYDRYYYGRPYYWRHRHRHHYRHHRHHRHHGRHHRRHH